MWFLPLSSPLWNGRSRSLVLLSASLLAMSTVFGDRGIWLSTLVSELGCLMITACCGITYFQPLGTEKSG